MLVSRPFQPTTRPPCDVTRRTALWIAWFCLFLQLLNLSHTVFSEHVRCAEHGEWVHAHDDHDRSMLPGDDGPVEMVEARRWERDAVVRAISGIDEHDHDHCVVCADRPNCVAASRMPITSVSIGSLQAALDPFLYMLVVADRRLFDCAPKTSPPAT